MTGADRERLRALLARPAVAALMAALNGEGDETRIVGGAVRNTLLGEPVSDLDFATTLLPAETMRRARAAGFKGVPTGIAHGTVTVVVAGEPFEVTTLRRDLATDGRHATVAFGRDFEADALRRDFTINALGLDRDGRLHDFCGGLADLAARRMRFIGDAHERIREDYLRILRFFRFFARYGRGEPDPEGYAACIAGRGGLERLSRERVRAELFKLLAAPRAADAVLAMLGAGLLLPILGGVPYVARLAAIAGEAGGGVHSVFRLAALAVATREDAVRLRDRLRLSNDEAGRIERIALALEAVSGASGPPALAALRRLAHLRGDDAVAAALVLVTANADPGARRAARRSIAGLGLTPAFLPTGGDVMALGIAAGPKVGRALEAARAAWIDADCPAGREAQIAILAGVLTAT